jgi:hypothetical protein
MQPTEDLIDFAQAILWNDGYAAFALGGHAPSPTALTDFFLQRTQQSVLITPLYDRGAIQRLQQWVGVRSVWFELRNSQAVQDEIHSRLGPFSGLIAQLSEQSEGVVIKQEITVSSVGRGARSRVLPNVTPQDLARLAEAVDNFDALVVSGITASGSIEHFDLVNERLHVEVTLPRAAGGGYHTDDFATFAALASAREQLETEGRLAAAAEGRLRASRAK